jgi:hypothetical protein
MMKRILWAISAIILMAFASQAGAFLNVFVPAAAIEYKAGSFSRNQSTHVLHDVVKGNSSTFLLPSVTSLTQIMGYAHLGQSGLTQSEANARIAKIQIWGWNNRAKNGIAGPADARNGTTRWVLLSELDPSTDASGGSRGNVIGYEVSSSDHAGNSSWGDILQSSHATGPGIHFTAGQSWLLLVRVIATNGVTNLCTDPTDPTSEAWDDGDTSNMIGSNVPLDKYVDAAGNTPGTTDHRLPDQAIVSVMIGQ